MEVRVYLTNLAEYNAGCLKGKWLDLPLDEDEIEAAFKEVLGSDEEYVRNKVPDHTRNFDYEISQCFITDYEADFSIEEYDNFSELNSFVEQLNELDEYEQEKVIYLLEQGYSRQDALEQQDDVIFYKGMTLEDVAEELVEEGCFGSLTDTIKGYLDYEKLARDLSIDGYHETGKGTFYFV